MKASFGILWVCCFLVVKSADIQPILKRCKDEVKARMSTCILSVIQDLRPYFADGIPEIGLPAMEPLFVGDVKFQEVEGANVLDAEFLNMSMTGASEFNIEESRLDYENLRSHTVASAPRLVLKGLYKLDAKLNPLHIKGEGTFWVVLKDISGKGGSIWTTEMINGRPHLQLKNLTMTFNTSDVSLRLNNLFNGDATLQEAINAFLNENSHELLSQFRPLLAGEVGKAIEKNINKVLRMIPMDDLAGGSYLKEAFGLTGPINKE